ncbi:2Fe-2S iron-sulfur cluster-binding protein [Bradyrhizobium sp. ISRA442]|uniref:2Fe-2S iron-sulfur cluster-binding protein n=1 Tax=Bradyrhizobium sp. ISRA442 TaxID=2866197 RepID=UPI0040491448
MAGATDHTEYFGAEPREEASHGFEVQLARSGRTLLVAPGRSILDTLHALGLDAPHSCKEGVCGACETRVPRWYARSSRPGTYSGRTRDRSNDDDLLFGVPRRQTGH